MFCDWNSNVTTLIWCCSSISSKIRQIGNRLIALYNKCLIWRGLYYCGYWFLFRFLMWIRSAFYNRSIIQFLLLYFMKALYFLRAYNNARKIKARIGRELSVLICKGGSRWAIPKTIIWKLVTIVAKLCSSSRISNTVTISIVVPLGCDFTRRSLHEVRCTRQTPGSTDSRIREPSQ